MGTNLLGFNRPQLTEFVASLGEKPFRAKQLMRWIHGYGEDDFARMSDLAASLRDKLAQSATIAAPRLVSEQRAADGTVKWLLEVGLSDAGQARNAIETVFIPEADRGTLCVSSQVGCALACTFCSTGRQGFNRNLTAAEIAGQLWFANRRLRELGVTPADGVDRRLISNVVMMGMGEPLANFDSVVTAMDVMLDDFGYGLSRRRVTLSTSGLVPWIARLRERCPVALAVSLHAPNDQLRDELVPINRKYPLAELLAACRDYLERAPRDFITFEYVMLDGVNDTLAHAGELARLLHDTPCKLNLIPFNPFADSGYRTSPRAAILAFRDALARRGYVVTIRKTRGQDIDAACGQLAGEVDDRTQAGKRLRGGVEPPRASPSRHDDRTQAGKRLRGGVEPPRASPSRYDRTQAGKQRLRQMAR